MSTIQATRIRKGTIVKIGDDLFRVLDLQHVTPGNLRGFVRVKFRNIRSGTLSDQKLRSEDFDALAHTFDDVVYGGRAAEDADVEEARSRWRQVVAR